MCREVGKDHTGLPAQRSRHLCNSSSPRLLSPHATYSPNRARARMSAIHGGCKRTMGAVMLMVMMLSIFTVSYENEFWQVWGDDRSAAGGAAGRSSREGADRVSKVTGFAHALPVAEGPKAGSGQGGAQISKKANKDRLMGEGLTSNMRGQPVQEAENNSDLGKGKVGEANNIRDAATLLSVKPPVGTSADSDNIPGEAFSESRQDSGLGEQNGNGPGEQVGKTERKGGPVENGKTGEIGFESPAYKTESGYEYVSKRKSRAKSFLVVFMGHSGSTAFTTELRTHTEFEVELLEPVDHGPYASDSDLALEKARELMDRGIAKGKIPGFKLRPHHLQKQPEAWRRFVEKYDTRVIWQYRENIVKQAVGEYRHRFLNDSSVVEGLKPKEEACAAGSGQKCRIRIEDMRGLHDLMNDFSSSDEMLSAAARELRRDDDLMAVRYEDYLYFRERTMRETFDFFGVDFQDTAPQRRKASPDNLCEMVSNFQELCDNFLPCQLWRPFLHDSFNNCRCKPGKWESFDSSFCRRNAWYQPKN